METGEREHYSLRHHFASLSEEDAIRAERALLRYVEIAVELFEDFETNEGHAALTETDFMGTMETH